MCVTHLCTSDINGGAARAAYRLHRAAKGISSTMFVHSRASTDPTVVKCTYRLIDIFRRVFWRTLRKREMDRYHVEFMRDFDGFSDDRVEGGATVLQKLPICDVVHLHWISRFVDYRSFFEGMAQRYMPIVWTLHDMNPFTGGCHYDRGCGRFSEGCGLCPQLRSSDPHDLSRKIFLRKQAAFSHIAPDMLQLVTPSQWLAEEVRHSALLQRFPVNVIPNGLDTSVFTPRDRYFAREVLDLPQDAHVLLFAATLIEDRRKGLSLLLDALADSYDNANFLLVSLGSTRVPLDSGIPYRHLGMIGEDRLLSLAYSAADVFIIPSLQDNLPNTVMESLACGTPVIGFNVGGILDMIRPGETGWLVPPRDVAALRTAIFDALAHPEKRSEMSVNCRRVVEQEYSVDIQFRRYLQLYEELVYRAQERRVKR
ncbi:glycosyltransferase [candidate division KSB3 bacterium]|uniref:Glycosyltransferase n=1 Tax=candidate division KSB3 bacterium TaxID=2044937 RepID=A0A9D5Q3W8_9BACT|nr:glycosyltransferase [candidate division KSB3 bacterium]